MSRRAKRVEHQAGRLRWPLVEAHPCTREAERGDQHIDPQAAVGIQQITPEDRGQAIGGRHVIPQRKRKHRHDVAAALFDGMNQRIDKGQIT